MICFGTALWLTLAVPARAESTDAEILRDLDFYVMMDALETVDPEFPLEETKEKR